MASLPYVTSPGNIEKALNGIKTAAVPDRVSQDFVKTILKIPGGSGDQMTTFLKKLGFTNPDGSPNEVYRKFRNPSSSGTTIAGAIKSAYAPLYIRNEFMHELSDKELLGLIVEETGLAHDAAPVKLTLNCIRNLKKFADFSTESENHEVELNKLEPLSKHEVPPPQKMAGQQQAQFGLNLGYTINLNLPATSDAAVYDAIFKSLRDNLLSRADG